MKLFEKMKYGYFDENVCTLRMKIDMKHENPNMKDPCAYRVRFVPHPHSGDAWCIYPTYDYTHCIIDSLENVTHSLCTLEFEIRRESYYWLLDALDIYRPNVWEYSRLNISNTVTSKRKCEALINTGKITGWDDPRMHTIQGLRRKGYTPTIINKFCASIGVARNGNENITSTKVLEHVARQEFIKTAPLTMAVMDGVLVKIVNFSEVEKTEAEIPFYVVNAARGSQKYKVGEEVYIDRCDFSAEPRADFFGLQPDKVTRLYYGPCIKIVEVVKTSSGDVDHIKVTRVPDDKKAKIIQWVTKSESVKATCNLYSALLSEENPAAAAKKDGKDWTDYFNDDSLVVMKNAYIWKHIANDFKVLDRY